MPPPPRPHGQPDLDEQLARWTAATLIEPAQAQRIAEYEAARSPKPTHPDHRRLPLVAEVLGYVGAVIALTALVVVVRQFWPHVPAAVELAFAGSVAVLLTVAGATVRVTGDPALVRLRSVLWLLATIGAAAFVAVLTDRILHMDYEDVAVITAATWTVYAIPLWWRGRSGLLHLSVFGGLVAVVETSISRVVEYPAGWEFGLGVWVVSLLWGAASWRGWLAPQTAGLVAAGSGVLVGALLTVDTVAGPAFALATVAGLLALGVATRRGPLLGLGAAGLIWAVPVAADKYLPRSAAAPVAVALVGLLLLAIAIWLARSRTSKTTG
jgi:hypothetical protein